MMRRSKYGSKPTVVDNIRFHSMKEANCYCTLKRLLRTNKITDLECQPSYQIVLNGIRICKVILDFRYKELPSKKVIIIDVKGHDTAMSKLKRKLVQAQYGIEVILL